MSFALVFKQVALLFAMLVVGLIAGKCKIFSAHFKKDLSTLLLYIACPLLVINSMIRDYDAALITDALIALFISLLFFGGAMALDMLLVKVLKVKKNHSGIWVLTTSFTNPGFMGFPVSYALFGADGMFLAAFVNLAQNILMYSIGTKVVLKDATKEGEKKSFVKTFVTPINISIVIGLIIFFCRIPIPDAITTGFVQKMANMVTPISLILVGISISEHSIIEVFKDLDAIKSAAVHLIVLPLILLVCLKPFNFHDGSIVSAICVLLACMPVPTMSTAVAEEYGSDSTFTSRAIFIANVFCLLTCPLIMALL